VYYVNYETTLYYERRRRKTATHSGCSYHSNNVRSSATMVYFVMPTYAHSWHNPYKLKEMPRTDGTHDTWYELYITDRTFLADDKTVEGPALFEHFYKLHNNPPTKCGRCNAPYVPTCQCGPYEGLTEVKTE